MRVSIRITKRLSVSYQSFLWQSNCFVTFKILINSLLSLSISNTSINCDKSKYEYGMEEALVNLRKKKKGRAIKVGLEDGMSRRASEELWQYENRYDSDNQTTFDRDNDSNVDGG